MDAESTKTPPHDARAELAVLGSAIVAAVQAMPMLSGLQVDEFFLPAHREAWAAILALFERRMPIDIVAVGAELQARGMIERFDGGWDAWAINAASSVPVFHHIDHYAKIVQDKATLRKVIELAAEVQSAAYGNQPADDVISRAREGVARLEVTGRQDGPEKIGKLLGGAIEVIQNRMVGNAPLAVPSGISGLDEILGGGFKPARLYYVGGRPGDGKTALAKTTTRHAATHGFPALMFSRETPNQETIEGHLAVLSNVPAFRISSARMTYDDWKHVQGAGNSLYEAELWLDDRSSTIERICANTRRWHALEVRRRGPKQLGIMALDYLQLTRIARARSGANREQVVAEMSRALKELAMELEIPVVALTQLKREAEERGGRPIPSDCRESGSIEQDADAIIFVYRDIAPEDKVTRNQPGPGELIVGKHRGGATGIADAYFETTVMHWRDPDGYVPPEHWKERGEQ